MSEPATPLIEAVELLYEAVCRLNYPDSAEDVSLKECWNKLQDCKDANFYPKLVEFVQDSICDCYDEYGHKRPKACDRCQLLTALNQKGGTDDAKRNS